MRTDAVEYSDLYLGRSPSLLDILASLRITRNVLPYDLLLAPQVLALLLIYGQTHPSLSFNE